MIMVELKAIVHLEGQVPQKVGLAIELTEEAEKIDWLLDNALQKQFMAVKEKVLEIIKG